MITWTLELRELPLRFIWKISRNATAHKTNLLINVSAGPGPAGWGEAAPNVRYGETPVRLQAEFSALLRAGLGEVTSLAALTALLAAQEPAAALRFALESAYVHWQAGQTRQTVPQLLGVPAPAPAVATALSLPIMEPGAVADFIKRENMGRFPLLKIKVNQESGYELLREVARAVPGRPVLIDGNEAWSDADALLQFLERLRTLPTLRVRLLEQPLPAACAADYRYLRSRSPYPLFADESVTATADFADIARQFHGVNVKLMKAGGYYNAIRLLRQTRAHGLQTMLGCMVETSLGIWSALQLSSLAQVCDLDGFLIVRDEPFGLVTEHAGQLSPAVGLPQLALPVPGGG